MLKDPFVFHTETPFKEILSKIFHHCIIKVRTTSSSFSPQLAIFSKSKRDSFYISRIIRLISRSAAAILARPINNAYSLIFRHHTQ